MSKKKTTTQPTDYSGQDAFSRTRQKLATIGLMQRFGLDGYRNTAASIGSNSPLMAGGGFARSDLVTEELTTAYRENWLAKKIIDMPAEDMTRKWYILSTSVGRGEVEEIRKLEAKHSIKREITNAIRLARLYGGAVAIIILAGDEDRMDQPLAADDVLPGTFQGLLVRDRTQAEPSLEKETDIWDPEFGLPKYYNFYVDDENGGSRRIQIHHSRVLRFTGREMPDEEMAREEYWGISELIHVWDPLENYCATDANAAELSFRVNLLCLKSNDVTEMLTAGTDEHTESVLKLLETENHLRTSYGLQLLGANDSMENLKYDFSGLPKLLEYQMLALAGASGIPATKLFGRSPEGMNATGESDMRNYYEMISALQEKDLKPALEKLVPIMAMSCLCYIPEDMEILFEPLMTLSTEDQIKQAKAHAEMLIELYQAGGIDREELREDLAEWSGRHGVLTKLKVKKEKSDYENKQQG